MSETAAGAGKLGGEPTIEVRDAQGVLIGPQGQQTNYIYLEGEAARRARVRFTGTVESPYRGLASFGEQDAAFFSGREAAASQVLERLSARKGGPALLVVSGASGAGKSSLLRAGVLPRITEAVPQVPPWPHVVLTPGAAAGSCRTCRTPWTRPGGPGTAASSRWPTSSGSAASRAASPPAPTGPTRR